MAAKYIPSSLVHGRVSAVTGTRIVLDEGEDKISIDTSALPDVVQVKQDDMVMAQGELQRELWDTRTFKAASIELIGSDQMPTEEEKAGIDQYPDDLDR